MSAKYIPATGKHVIDYIRCKPNYKELYCSKCQSKCNAQVSFYGDYTIECNKRTGADLSHAYVIVVLESLEKDPNEAYRSQVIANNLCICVETTYKMVEVQDGKLCYTKLVEIDK